MYTLEKRLKPSCCIRPKMIKYIMDSDSDDSLFDENESMISLYEVSDSSFEDSDSLIE